LISNILVRDFEVPRQIADNVTETFLARYRFEMRFPNKILPTLEKWRLQLWSQTLGEKYAGHADIIYKKWKEIRNRCLIVPESTLNFLRKLRKRYSLALITNGHSGAQWEKINDQKLENYFDAVAVSGDLEWEKPAPEIFYKVCKNLGVEPYECLMIGDRLETDILGGFQAQFGIVVWLPLPHHNLNSPSPTPDFVIHDIFKLLKLLQVEQSMVPKKSNERSRRLSNKLIDNDEESTDDSSDSLPTSEEESNSTTSASPLSNKPTKSICSTEE